MKSKIKGIYFFILGILVTGIDINIAIKISYGFRFGVNEGVKKGFNTYFLEALIGDHFRIDILFNPAGGTCIDAWEPEIYDEYESSGRSWICDKHSKDDFSVCPVTVQSVWPDPVLLCCRDPCHAGHYVFFYTGMQKAGG